MRSRNGRTRRRRISGDSTGIFLDAFLRIAGAIVLETLAFIVWNLGSRSPVDVLRAAARALGDVRAMFVGVVALGIGIVFVAAATVLLMPAFTNAAAEFVPIELATFLVALGIDKAIGRDLRTAAGVGEGSSNSLEHDVLSALERTGVHPTRHLPRSTSN